MKKLLIALLIGLMLLSVACSSPKADSGVLVTIDKDLVITQEDFDRNLALVKYNQMARYGADYFEKISPEELKHIEEDILDEMITENLILREAKAMGIELNKEDMDAYYNQYMQATFGPPETPSESGKQIRTYLTEHKIDDAFLRTLLERDRLVRQYIVSLQDDLEGDEAKMAELNSKTIAQVKGAHILVGLDQKELADELYATLSQDPSKFAELAKEHSKDGSAANGGELGYYTRGEMVVPFSDASFSATIGKVTEPVETQYGYHLILISEQRTLADMEEAEESAEVIDLAKRNLVQDEVRKQYYARIDALKANATIEQAEKK